MQGIPLLSPQRSALQHQIFRAALERATSDAKTNPEESARWALLTAEIADAMGCGGLMSPDLEALLLELSGGISRPVRGEPAAHRRWLHVLSEAYRVGGHTALVARWITLDPGDDRHSVVLTFMDATAVPEALNAAVLSKGGTIQALGEVTSLVERARRLREMAWRDFDVVVLHIHMWDVVPVMAFGVAGGPPVLLLNHADHTFWLGATVADSVISIRQSGQDVTERFRGVNRHEYLPIPLPSPVEIQSEELPDVRKILDIPDTAPLFITVGSHIKYLGIGAVDFIATAHRLLDRLPEAYLVAVGPMAEHPDWEAARRLSGGRMMAVGPQLELRRYFAAADVYLEGFPFGSLTALLEAGLAGLPCIRAPAVCPPPFTSDGEALENLPQPRDLDAYIEQAVTLATMPMKRRGAAIVLRESIEKIHMGAGWQSRLLSLKTKIPASHKTHQASGSDIHPLWNTYWTPYLVRKLNGDPLLFYYVRGHQIGLIVHPTLRLLLAARNTRIPERPRESPGPITLGLLRALIEPIAARLHFTANKVDRTSWTQLTFRYWFNRYIGWRLKIAPQDHETKRQATSESK